MAQQGSLEWSTSRLNLEWEVHLTSRVLAPHGPVWHPEHLYLHSLQLTVQAQYSVPMRLVLDDQFVSIFFA